jgi:hypothetical protein
MQAIILASLHYMASLVEMQTSTVTRSIWAFNEQRGIGLMASAMMMKRWDTRYPGLRGSMVELFLLNHWEHSMTEFMTAFLGGNADREIPPMSLS